MPHALPPADLALVLDSTRDLWEDLRGERLFITGGTGFFGRWLLESFVHANDRLGLNARAVVLTRDAAAFAARAPGLAAHPALECWPGDVAGFAFPPGHFACLVHAATDTGVALNAHQPLAMLDATIAGTRHTLAFAQAAGVGKALLTSSGLIYGPLPPGMAQVREDHPGGPDPLAPGVAYAEGKRVAELLFATAHRETGLTATIARCFAFVGPCLPLDAHFAVGNFLRDALAGGPIRIGGDGTPWRSYMHAADLSVWLWTILLRGAACRAYNVGSDHGAPLETVAHEVARLAGGLEVAIAKPLTPGAPINRYVPDTQRAQGELGLALTYGREEALKRTLAWHRV